MKRTLGFLCVPVLAIAAASSSASCGSSTSSGAGGNATGSSSSSSGAGGTASSSSSTTSTSTTSTGSTSTSTSSSSSSTSTTSSSGGTDAGPDGSLGSLCAATGGTAGMQLCCAAVGDFPSTCDVGGCTCAPSSSKMVLTCDCGSANKCFDPTLGCINMP